MRILPIFVLPALIALPVSAQSHGSADRKTAEPIVETTGVTPPVESSGEAKPNEWRKFFRNVGEDQGRIWASPFRMNKKTAPWWLLFGGAAAVLIATDHSTATKLPNTQDQMAVATWTSRLGASYSIIPITATFWLGGVLADSPRAREVGRVGVEALTDAFIVNNVIKAATQRQRPTEGEERGAFWAGTGRFWNAGSSFPSGHATYAFTLASVIAHEYHDSKIIPITAYALATTVGASRFAARKHYASDIVAGAAVGWFIGHYVYGKRHNPDLAHGKPGVKAWFASHVRITPVFAR
jgi:membrane-associated phospholipid phosphatase